MTETRQWWVQRVGGDYKLIRDLGSGEFLSYDWRAITTGIPGPYLNLHQLGFARVGLPMLSVDDAAGTYDATGWTVAMGTTATEGYKARTVNGTIAGGTLTRFTATAGPGTFLANDKGRRIEIPGAGAAGAALIVLIGVVGADGSYVTWTSPNGVAVTAVDAVLHACSRWANTAGKIATWTSPAATSVGVRVQGNTSGGLFLVTLDGSTTAANRLPTAQAKVTAGEYPNTILVANGGTLQPTDRVLDCYSSTTQYDMPAVVADGLAAAAHTLVLTVTGYTHTGGINNRGYVTGYSWSTGTETPTTAGAEILGTFAWQTGVSAHEYAYRWVPNFGADGTTPNPNAGTNPITYYGRVHGYEDQTSIAIVIDGAGVSLTDGQCVAVTTAAVITQVSVIHHPDNLAATSANSTTTYTLDAAGMSIEHTQTWAVPAVMLGGYPTMLPLAGAFDRYTASGVWDHATSNLGDGSRAADAASWLSCSWTSADKYATSTEMSAGLATLAAGFTNPAMDTWWLEDRAPSSGVKINKQYGPWKATPSNPVPISPGDVWHFKTRYRFKRFPGGAEAALGTL